MLAGILLKCFESHQHWPARACLMAPEIGVDGKHESVKAELKRSCKFCFDPEFTEVLQAWQSSPGAEDVVPFVTRCFKSAPICNLKSEEHIIALDV